MKAASTALQNQLKQSTEINCAVRLIAEWNQNRYSPIISVINGGIEDYDSEMFPIDSISLPNRPTSRGVLKARASSSLRTTYIGADGFTNSGYQDTPLAARYTTCSVDSKYKYWTSPYESAGSYHQTPSTMTGCSPTINYASLTWCNKVVVGFESSYAHPTLYTVSVHTSAGWAVIATNTAIPANGRVEIYHQGSGVWSTTVNNNMAVSPTRINGINVTVTQMDKAQVFFNLIELSARLEVDISQSVISYSTDNTMSNTSFITPLGTSSSNTASVVLDNTDKLFTNDNSASLFYDILDKNVDFRLDEGTLVNGQFEWIRQLTMKTDLWEGQNPDTTTVSLVDYSIYLQSIKPNPTFYQSMTIGEIVWRLLDSIGFVNYTYESRDDDPSTLIPYFWTDGTKTMWDIFNELSQPTQTAIYFDEYNYLQIQTRNAAYDLTKPVDWTLDGETNGTKLADIVTIDKTFDYEANTVNVLYTPTSVSDDNNGIPIMESVWEPGGDTTSSKSASKAISSDLVLRAVPLVISFSAVAMSAMFSSSYMATWPYAGIIEIQGEFIRYNAKGYSYYAANGALIWASISSEEERIALNKKNPQQAYRNFFNGYLFFETRGLWNTFPQSHTVEINGYTNQSRTYGGAIVTTNNYFMPNFYTSALTLRPDTSFVPNSWYVSTRGSINDTFPIYYGTRMKFAASGYSFGAAGMAMCVGPSNEGYYIELMKTSLLNGSVGRTLTSELCFYVKYAAGHIVRFGPNGGKGNIMAVSPDIWYDIDVAITSTAGGNYTFSIRVNGMDQFTVTVPISQRVSLTGRYGVFTRGNTWADYEYLYASTFPGYDAFDEEGFFDRVTGGYQSSQLMSEWVYDTRNATRVAKGVNSSYAQRYNQTVIDEFGPIAHEVREFDIKFTKTPVLHSRLYLSNDTQIICPEYNGNSFGAKFILGNVARVNAIANGDDTLTFGSDNPVTQHTLIYGRVVTQDSETKYTVTSDIGIRRRGEVSVDVQSSWIQSEAAAKALGEWIIKHWSGGADEVEVSIFGNPLFELGDLVAINSSATNMTSATHKYFVVKVSQSYNNGLETALTLRRAKV